MPFQSAFGYLIFCCYLMNFVLSVLSMIIWGKIVQKHFPLKTLVNLSSQENQNT